MKGFTMSKSFDAQMIDIPVELYHPAPALPTSPKMVKNYPPIEAQPTPPRQLGSAFPTPRKLTPIRQQAKARRRKGLSRILQADTIHVVRWDGETQGQGDGFLTMETCLEAMNLLAEKG
jgi:hypothetical protein